MRRIQSLLFIAIIIVLCDFAIAKRQFRSKRSGKFMFISKFVIEKYFCVREFSSKLIQFFFSRLFNKE